MSQVVKIINLAMIDLVKLNDTLISYEDKTGAAKAKVFKDLTQSLDKIKQII